MSGGEYFEWIRIYYALDIGVSTFRSYDRNLVTLCASEIVIFNNSFYSKRYAAGDAVSSGDSSLSPSTVNLTLNSYEFSGW